MTFSPARVRLAAAPEEQRPVRMIVPAEVPAWIVYEDARLLVVQQAR